MFTGIVQAKGIVAAAEPKPFGVRLVIDCRGGTPLIEPAPATGDSICVCGVCLTVTDRIDTAMAFDVIAETLARTTLGDLGCGAEVNLEPAVTANQPLGGHIMQGHIDGVGRVTVVDAGRFTIEPPAELMDCIVPKGSTAVDGVSLTVASVENAAFEVALIPTTLDQTTLGATKAGDRVNLETDIISKTVVNWLRRQGAQQPSPVTVELLRDAGFVL